MASNLRLRPKLDYKMLNDGPCLQFAKTICKAQPRVLEEEYFVDRILWRRQRKDTKVSKFVYLFIYLFTIFVTILWNLYYPQHGNN